jgi:uncharacterized membrane protein YfhO
MPFLILGLMGVDKYFSNHKSGLFIISIFLMIMTSYYYSVCGLLTLFIYGVYKYISLHKLKFKSFIIDMIKFIWPMLIGIIMASIILIPTLMTLISRDTSNISSFDIKSLLLPSFNSKAIMYSSYGIGLTGIFLIAIIYHLLQSKKEKLFLVLSMITITMIPIFMLILNGMLYSRSKAFIPLLPLGCLLIAHFIMDFKNNKMNNKLLLIILFISLILYAPFNIENCLFYLDLFLMITFLIYSKYLKNIRIFYGILFIAAIGTFIVNNKSENFVGINTYNNVFNKEVSSLINKTIDQDKSIYRFNNLLDNNLYTVNEIYNSKYYSDSLYSSTYNSDYHELFNSVNAFPYRNSLIPLKVII